MAEKQYVKDYKEQIGQIDEHLKAIAKIAESLPAEASWKKSIDTSVVNFQKKITGFLESASKVELTDEQKAAIAAIKKGNVPTEILSKISANVETTTPTGTGSNDQKPPKKASGKKH